jgi:CRP/FNR family cyclic AMP-dependent transcriptional regulator
MFFTLSGRFLLRELSLELGVGEMVGELGLLAPENRRSQTLECVEAGEVLTIAYDQVRQLYFQNPAFGFYFLRLTTRRLFQNVARLEGELASLRGRPPALAHTATTTPASGSGFRQASETDAPARTSE